MVRKETFDSIEKFTIENKNIKAEFISFGARLTKLVFNGIDVLLGYDYPADYLTDTLFIGATVGRFAGRIGKTKLNLNGCDFQLDQNENETTCHHGGYNAFDKRFWNGCILSENAVSFSRTSLNGEGGFPGNLEVTVTYTLLENGIQIQHVAKTDQETIVNLANHAYFNLAGFDHPDAREMHLSLEADRYLPLNQKLIPTGEVVATIGTEFDFSKDRKIAVDLDHYFVFKNYDKNPQLIGTLHSPSTGIRMDIVTDQPGVQIYTCGAFSAEKGKGGIPLHFNQGIALETQGFPDNPNHPNFPKTYLLPEETYLSTTKFLFSAI